MRALVVVESQCSMLVSGSSSTLKELLGVGSPSSAFDGNVESRGSSEASSCEFEVGVEGGCAYPSLLERLSNNLNSFESIVTWNDRAAQVVGVCMICGAMRIFNNPQSLRGWSPNLDHLHPIPSHCFKICMYICSVQ